MGVEDTLENRKRFVATIPMGASRPRTTWSTLVSGSRDDPEFTTDMRIEVDGGRWV
jgi:3-oxoacyl-[acyl-carrier protein] reductase